MMDFLKQYAHIRGFNYTPSSAVNDVSFWRDYDPALVERELDLAARLGLNSARVFLSYVVYEHDGSRFLERVRHFLRAAHARGISVMPVVWDSCFDETIPTYETQKNDWVPNPGVLRLGPDFWPEGERYCRDLVEALRDESGLLLWDVMNEPRVTSWLAGPEAEARTRVIWAFVRHFCAVMQRLDPQHPITVGVHTAEDITQVGQYVDVISCHDYRSTRAAIRAHIGQVLGFCAQYGKPALLSEIGCLARSNPYDVTLEICQDVGIGWYLWELMIGQSMWRDIHGVVYPDGTVRDPSIVAAIRGFFRKRSGDIVLPNVDKEGEATRTLWLAEAWLKDEAAAYADGLQLLERLANQLEAGELVPMADLPSIKVLALADESALNRQELRRILTVWTAALASAVSPSGEAS